MPVGFMALNFKLTFFPVRSRLYVWHRFWPAHIRKDQVMILSNPVWCLHSEKKKKQIKKKYDQGTVFAPGMLSGQDRLQWI